MVFEAALRQRTDFPVEMGIATLGEDAFPPLVTQAELVRTRQEVAASRQDTARLVSYLTTQLWRDVSRGTIDENSSGVKFANDITAYRVIERVDGRGWLQSAITPNKGTNTLSPFVTLDERA